MHTILLIVFGTCLSGLLNLNYNVRSFTGRAPFEEFATGLRCYSYATDLKTTF